MTEQFITPARTHALLKFIEEHQDKKLIFEVREYKRERSLEQNARYWAILTDIAEQVKPEDREFAPETWHEFFKAKFLGKDTMVIDGEPVLVQRTTTKLRVMEFIDYCTQVEAWAIEHGVHFWDRFEAAS